MRDIACGSWRYRWGAFKIQKNLCAFFCQTTSGKHAHMINEQSAGDSRRADAGLSGHIPNCYPFHMYHSDVRLP